MSQNTDNSYTLDYYEVGTKATPVVSNSSMSYLNPEEGGSIVKFLNSFEEKVEAEEKGRLKEGKLLHSYMEDSTKFAVSEVERPDNMLGDLCDSLFKNIDTVKAFPNAFTDINIAITSSLKKESGRNAEILGTTDKYKSLSEALKVPNDDLIACLRKARIEGKFYKSYTDEGKVVEMVLEKGVSYLKELANSNGKIILNKATKEAVDGASTSLYTNKKIAGLLHLGNNVLDVVNLTDKIYSELPIYWQEKVTILGNDQIDVKLNCKAKPDKVIINFQEGTIKLIDLKTTSYPLSLFMTSFMDYRYYRQLAYYVKALSQWFRSSFPDLDIGKFKLSILIVAVETKGLYQSCIYEIPLSWVQYGKNEYMSILKRYAWHKHTGDYKLSYEEATSATGYISLPEPKN